MRTFFALLLLLLPWALIAPLIAKGYGDWHWPNPFGGQAGDLADGLIFYLPPFLAAALVSKRLFGKLHAPNR